jgi:hypothetical protein
VARRDPKQRNQAAAAAIGAAEQALRCHTMSPDTHGEMTQCLALVGNKWGARAEADRALDLAPLSPARSNGWRFGSVCS